MIDVRTENKGQKDDEWMVSRVFCCAHASTMACLGEQAEDGRRFSFYY